MFRSPVLRIAFALAAGAGIFAGLQTVAAQAPATAQAVPHSAGTVKATAPDGFTVTSATGDVAVSVPATAKVLVVPPGSKDLKAATPGTLSDVTAGDRVLVTGTTGDSATALIATRVVLMKAGAIAQSHAADEAAWAQGSGGIVKSVDVNAGTIVLSSGMKTITVTTTPGTIVRRYANGSVRFQDASVSTLAMVRAGDQLRVRGAKSADGSSIAADEVVAGSFENFSGLLTAVDASGGTVTLKDLATKKTVVVVVTPSSELHRLPAQVAQGIAARMKGGAGAPGGAAPAGGAPGAGTRGAGAAGGAGRDLSSMMARLPAETLAGLKVGDAVMIVATAPGADLQRPTAVTVLAGVDAILTAPSGETMTLTPWSVGGSGGGMGDAGGGGI